MEDDTERELRRVLGSTDFFPLRLDIERNALLFVRMSRQSYRRSTFLDERALPAGSRCFSIKPSMLVPLVSSWQSKRPLHFILHGAFCGSTVLARSLEELPRCFVIKEPKVLAQLAMLKGNAFADAAFAPYTWFDWFSVLMALLARGDATDKAVIVKTPDQCNCVGEQLLDRDVATKVVFLCSPLKVFLLSVLKSNERRKWLRQRIRALTPHLSRVPFLSDVTAAGLDDGRSGAALWLLNSYLCRRLLERSDAYRILPLSSEDLIAHPEATLGAVADFMGLLRDEANRAALATFRPISYYAKDPDTRVHFDAATRAAHLGDLEAYIGGEVETAVLWAKDIGEGWLDRSPFPMA